MVNIASSALQKWLLVIAFALTLEPSSAGAVQAQSAHPRWLTLSDAIALTKSPPDSTHPLLNLDFAILLLDYGSLPSFAPCLELMTEIIALRQL
jgi:hypothetical protein